MKQSKSKSKAKSKTDPSSYEFSPGLRHFAESEMQSPEPKITLSVRLRRDYVEQFKKLAEIRGQRYTEVVRQFLENAIESSPTVEKQSTADLRSEINELRVELRELRELLAAQASSKPDNNEDFEIDLGGLLD